MSIPFNPMQTVNAAGSFNVTNDGFVQGTAMDDPAIRYKLRSGYVSGNITLYGGMAISQNIPTPGASTSHPSGVLQSPIVLATQIAGTTPEAGDLNGFTVFDQAYNMYQTPQSPVPSAGQDMTVNFYPLGSGARIAVACDPILADLESDVITSQVGWDFGAQMLVAYESSSYSINSTGNSYTSATGVIVITLTTTPAFSEGDLILSSLTGTGAYASLNGTWPITSVVGDVVTLQGPVGEGSATITGGTVTEDTTQSKALPCQILGFNFGNSMTVEEDQYGNFFWNRSGSCALIRI